MFKRQSRAQTPDFTTEFSLLTLPEPQLFPKSVLPLELHEGASLALAEDLMATKTAFVAVFARREGATSRDDVDAIGVIARVIGTSKQESGSIALILQGIVRVQLVELIATQPYPRVRLEPLLADAQKDEEAIALRMSLRDATKDALSHLPPAPRELAMKVTARAELGDLADFLAGTLPPSAEERRALLVQLDGKERARAMLRLLFQRQEEHLLNEKLSAHVSSELDKSQRQFMLRQQRKAIEHELGEGIEAEHDALEELAKKADALPEEPAQVARKQISRLRTSNPAAPDYSMTRGYLDWILELPWTAESHDSLDLARVRQVLDEDHHGLEKVKRRIIEFLAVRKIAKGAKTPILCLVGPPGVGKTSLGKSVARAMNRKLQRISLGGVHDEASIRGHRRTYVGAMPGRVIQAIRKAGVRNPVLLLDEIDKLGRDVMGDPASALLEVLDPEQNNTFTDHYIEIPFDLSRALFITTANALDTVPAPLRDRMEVIEVSGYTRAEKLAIARQHLVPKQLEEHGVRAEQLTLTDEALSAVIEGYTREAGVRGFERSIAALVRQKAVRLAQGEQTTTALTSAEDITRELGPPRFASEKLDRGDEVGIASGLARTSVGGELLHVEVSMMPGDGKLTLTGQLGEVMRESARAAVSYVKSNAERLGIAADIFERSDIHLHVPAGAVPKDGPSAGLTMLAALVSLLTGNRARLDTAMTGEITLRGRVLPVGGIKEKLLAAHRAGVKRVVIPERNRHDLEDVPPDVRAELDVRLVSRMDEALEAVLEQRVTPFVPQSRRRGADIQPTSRPF